jgi:hypothetical protein
LPGRRLQQAARFYLQREAVELLAGACLVKARNNKLLQAPKKVVYAKARTKARAALEALQKLASGRSAPKRKGGILTRSSAVARSGKYKPYSNVEEALRDLDATVVRLGSGRCAPPHR